MRNPFMAAMVVFLLAIGAGARAEGPRSFVEANTSFWWTIQEQVENDMKNQGTDEAADDEASGFNFKLGRVGFIFQSTDGRLEGLIRFRLEERTDVIDFWGAYHASAWFNFYIGQMKIPSTAEVMAPDHLTDFISRTGFGSVVSDYSLSRTPFTSPLMGVRSYNRDLGVAMKGGGPDRDQPLFAYFLMISNGIGSNNYIGGQESQEFIITNDFGEYYYGLRLEGRPYSWLSLGGHYSLNNHDNVILQDKSTVADFERTAWSADAQLAFPFGLRIAGFYGEGELDDMWRSLEYMYDYSGWGVWALQSLFNDRFELGLRYDSYASEHQEDGNQTEQNNWTYGMNFRPHENLRLQLNYVWKDTINDYIDDLDDDILYLNVQFMFDAALAP